LHSDYGGQLGLYFADSPNAQNKSKMADGCHLEKSQNGHIYARVWPICTKFGTTD